MKVINFTKKGELEIINAAGKKTGLKSLDEYLASNPQADHEDNWIFRLKIEPLEFLIKGEKRKIETIDFFCNARIGMEFFLKNVLSDNSNFELKWIEKLEGDDVGFSEINPNTLVVETVPLYFETEPNLTAVDLEIDWENITLLDKGLVFSLISPKTISLNQHNFTYDKVFWHPAPATKYYDYIKQRLTEWKSAKKPFILNKVFVSFGHFLSVKDSRSLYVYEKQGQYRETELTIDLNKEKQFIDEITDWLKLPYSQREKFIKRYWKGDQEIESMKSEIEAAIKALENDNPPKNQNNPANNKAETKKELKILLWIGGIILIIELLIVLIYRNYQKKTRKS